MRRIWAIAVVLFGSFNLAPSALAEKRVALVIGNSNYRHVGSLTNPANDARLIADTLHALGFTLVEGGARLDLDEPALRRVVQAFGEQLQGADVGLFYYAGHGVQVRGANYLVPVGANPTREADVDFQMLDTNAVLRQMEAAGTRLSLVILDACRNNPFGGRGLRTTAPGLAQMQAPKGTLISFATQPGNVALDGTGSNSPFTLALAHTLRQPGLGLFDAFNAVGLAVERATGGAQQPWVSSSPIAGTFYFAGLPAAPSVTSPPAQPAPADPDAAARRDYELAAQVATKEAWDAFLARHPSGYYADLARVQRGRLAVVVPPVRPAAPSAPVQPAVGVFGVNPLSATHERALKPKDTFKECDSCPEMVVVPAGSFIMGSPLSEQHREADEGSQRRVTFSRQFAVGKFAVTFDEWDACVADGGCNRYRPADSSWGRGRRPAINISWNDAKAYVDWLSRKTGKTYRLLSEAEREYVTRAGTTTPFWWGSTISTSQANYNGNHIYGGGSRGEYRQKTAPVGTFQANPWGVFEVHGNVWEWVEDCWNRNYAGAPTDGSAWTTGECTERVRRGGAWDSVPWYLRSATRDGIRPDISVNLLGFRVARTLEQVDAPSQRTETPPPVQQAVVAPPIVPATPPDTAPKPAVGVFKVNPLSASQERALKPKDTFKECDTCPEMVVVPAGSFTMGSPASEKERGSDEGPQRRVTFSRAFAVGKFAVTFDEWNACVADGGCNGYRPDDRGWGRGRRPVINVNWDDAKAYVAWLSRKTGRPYRLLSEAEREYVTRADTTTPFWWGSSISTGQANYDGNYTYGSGSKGEFRNSTMPVNSFQPNPWGLYQVHGNVWEWVEDCWNGSHSGAPTDGSASTSGECNRRVIRGGSWGSYPKDLRSALRVGYPTVSRGTGNGFRVARTLLTP